MASSNWINLCPKISVYLILPKIPLPPEIEIWSGLGSLSFDYPKIPTLNTTCFRELVCGDCFFLYHPRIPSSYQHVMQDSDSPLVQQLHALLLPVWQPIPLPTYYSKMDRNQAECGWLCSNQLNYATGVLLSDVLQTWYSCRLIRTGST